MTNEERRRALAKARRKAVEYAEEAERGGISISPADREARRDHANMWANVAQCLKVGAPDGPDAIDGVPVNDTLTYGNFL